jgi:hypothetical protein
MSKYLKVSVEFRDEDTFAEALAAVCAEREIELEKHDEAVRLFGYQGDLRDERANWIIRRKHVGMSANDLGFRREGGEVVAVISEFDSRNKGQRILNHVKREYARRKVTKMARRRGLEVEEVQENGAIRLRLRKRRGRGTERRVRVRR